MKAKLSNDELEILKIFAKLYSVNLQDKKANTKENVIKTVDILKEYYLEKTMLHDNIRINQFKEVKISEEEVKYALACVRRLGYDIS